MKGYIGEGECGGGKGGEGEGTRRASTGEEEEEEEEEEIISITPESTGGVIDRYGVTYSEWGVERIGEC